MAELLKGYNPDGPSVALIAGVHGNELTPIYMLDTLKSEFQSDILEHLLTYVKSLTIYNYFNKSAIKECKRGVTNDLNRVLGTDNLRLKLENIVLNNDVIIDIHSSPNITELVLIDNDSNAKNIVTWCKNSYVPYLCRHFNGKTIKSYAFSKGKVGITLELVGLDTFNENSALRGITLLERLLTTTRSTKLRGKVQVNTEVKAHKSGIFKPYGIAKLQTIIIRGTILGTISCINTGKVQSRVIATHGGSIMTMPDKSYVKKNDVLFLIQKQ